MTTRETIGQRLRRARESQGLSAEKLSKKIFDEYGFKVGGTTIFTVEADESPNTGHKTIKYICLGLGLDPLEVFAIDLESPPKSDSGYVERRFAKAAQIYKAVEEKEKPFINRLFDIFIEQMERAKSK